MHRTQSNKSRQHCSRRQEETHTHTRSASNPHSLSAWPRVVNPVQGNVRSIRRIHFNLYVFTHPQSSKYVHTSKVILYRSNLNMFLILLPQHAQMRGLFAEEGSIKIWAQIAATTTILSVTCKLCFVARLSLEPTRMFGRMIKYAPRQVWKQGKQMFRSAKVSSLCAVQPSPSAWAGFAPKLTATRTVARTKSCFRPHSGPSSCAHRSLGVRLCQ